MRFRLKCILTKAFKSIIFDFEIDYKGGRDMKKIVLAVCIILAVIAVAFALKPSELQNDSVTTEYAWEDMDFPVITKAVLYRDGISEEIAVNDERIAKMTEYIITAIREFNYAYVTGVLPAKSIESKKEINDTYMMLDLKLGSNEIYARYDQALIAGTEVIFIDSDSVSYLGEGNPANECISPYRKYLEDAPDILEKFFGE